LVQRLPSPGGFGAGAPETSRARDNARITREWKPRRQRIICAGGIVVGWATRHRILTWAIAWGVAGIGFFTADIFSRPRQGPLWVAVVFGLVAWSTAGALSFNHAHVVRGVVVWALAYVVAFWLGAIWGASFERNGSGGFVGALLGWAVGGAVGTLLSGYISASRRRRVGPLISAVAWGLSFFVGGYVALVAGMYLAQAAKGVLAVLGQRAALTIGWGLGAMIGGALASALGMAASDSITEPPSEFRGCRTFTSRARPSAAP
jgi:hypothetical protein